MRFFFTLLYALLLAAPAYPQTAETPPVNIPAVQEPAAAFIPAPATDATPATPAPVPTAAPAAPQGPLALLNSKGDKDQYLDITADQSLEWHEDESVYIARGHAIAKRGELQVKADTLKAYNRKKPDGSSEVFKMEAEGNVEIFDKAHTVTGDKGEYNIDTKKATLTGDNLRFTTGTDVVTAKDSFEYSETENKITAHGSTKALRDGRQVEADTMIAYLTNNKTGGQDIDKMEAKGNVHIVTKEDAVLCNDAVYNLTANSAVLTGNVRITRGGNQLRGDKVVADFKTGRSKLINTGTGRVSALIGGSGVKPGMIGGKKSNGKTGGGIMPGFIPASDSKFPAKATP